MAENKKSFILYCDLIHTVEKLPIEKAGELFVHILKYVNDQDPKTDDLLLNIAFEPIKQSLKRDLKRYESKKEDRSLAGRLGNLKRYNPDIYDKVSDEKLTIEQGEELAKRRKTRKSEKDLANVAVNDSVSVSVSVSDIKKENNIHIAQVVKFSFDDFWELYPNKVGKTRAKEKFNKLSDAQVEKIENHLPLFIKNPPFKDYSFPHPTTYLNQERFEDEIQISNLKNIKNEKFNQLTTEIRKAFPDA